MMLSAPAKSPADRFCPETAWMSAAVTPLRETVPPLAGHVGVPVGPGAAVDPHSHRETPPLTAGWPKWMWAMDAGLDSFPNVSVEDRVEPVTVASEWPVLGARFGRTSCKTLSLSCID